MKLFIYKLIFPECNKLYIGIASSESRYQSPINSKFTQPTHHNPDVQKLLNQGEFCYWRVIKEFETFEELKTAEKTYLQKVWKTNEIQSRPDFLLNATNEEYWGRAAGWNHSDESKQKIGNADYSIRNYRTSTPLEIRERKTGFDFRTIWNEVETAMNATTSYHWGGAKIARKFNISRRTIAKISCAIRNNITFDEWSELC